MLCVIRTLSQVGIGSPSRSRISAKGIDSTHWRIGPANAKWTCSARHRRSNAESRLPAPTVGNDEELAKPAERTRLEPREVAKPLQPRVNRVRGYAKLLCPPDE